MIGKDWMKDAAREIIKPDKGCFCVTIDEEFVLEIIARHCPFKVDVAYVPVDHNEGVKMSPIVCWRCGRILIPTSGEPPKDDGTLPAGTEVTKVASCHHCCTSYEIVVRKL